MIIGTAGHIDHGKTTLVKALTGVDADRLPEEKARGITLDLGYAYTASANGNVLGFVDVPGHEKLIHNMLAGATGIDYLLLVVAADDGPMPQTREHLAIANLLGITQGAVVLTKCDVVTPERQEAARLEVHALLAGTAFAEAPLFPVAARNGEGITALKTHLEIAAELQPSDNPSIAAGRFRLAIDRCFSLSGIGTVVTGTVFSGSVSVGDTLIISPPGFTARVRGLHAQDRPAETGHTGQRVALNLVGDFARESIHRGQWALDPRQHLPIDRFAVTLKLSHEETTALKHWTPVHVHLGAEDITGRIALLEGDSLAPGGDMLAEILLDRALCCAVGDRFIVRDTSASRTLGGGQVLDIFPPTRHKRAPTRLEALRLAASASPTALLAHQLASSTAGVLLERFAQAWNLPDDAATQLWHALELKIIDSREGMLGFSPAVWLQLGDKLVSALAAEHERAPDMLGAEHERLRRLTLPTLPRAAFDQLVDEALANERIAQTSSWLHLPEHRVTLSAADTDLWASFSPLLSATPCQPPRVRDIATTTGLNEDAIRALMKRVARTGKLYPVALDHYFTDAAVASLAGIVADLHREHKCVRAAELRDRIGGGRKVAIHILEFFDRIGYTRRVRDQRSARDEHVLRETTKPQRWIN